MQLKLVYCIVKKISISTFFTHMPTIKIITSNNYIK